MNSLNSNETVSVWTGTVEMPTTPSLAENIHVDVCIVGGGMGGLNTAYMLMKEGKSVCVIEAGELGDGQTGKTSAHFSDIMDKRYYQLEKYHGEEGARIIANSQNAALDRLERIVELENIQCNLRRVPAYLYQAPETDPTILDKELAALKTIGGIAVERVVHVPVRSFNSGPALVFPNQIEFHPLKYLKGLAEVLLKNGVQIFTHTHAVEIKGGVDAFVRTKNDFKVTAANIVVATNSPINNIFAIHTKQAPYRTYIVGMLIPKGSVPHAFYWDTDEPYHYVRVAPENAVHDILIIGGEDHKTGQNKKPEESFERLQEWARERFPVQETLYRWSGQIMESIDGIAFLGHNPMDPDNIFVITGDSGNGLTSCMVGAMLITDQIQGRENPWSKIYNPSRKILSAAGPFLSENANVAWQYKDWLGGASSKDLEELKNDEGMVINHGLKKIAVYKHANGALEAHSAVCTHLGCVVAWNGVEKSWDCPCHGSRFDCHGQVIEGPATQSLAEVDSPTEQAQESDPVPYLT
jgi:glycine/D-amino acid oxidase-like deaminating enzyme/nitrite reductase/ring-hydroxylating ferredoxin subunit